MSAKKGSRRAGHTDGCGKSSCQSRANADSTRDNTAIKTDDNTFGGKFQIRFFSDGRFTLQDRTFSRIAHGIRQLNRKGFS
jgi:hypothetical protein